jgi:hypothetical protein
MAGRRGASRWLVYPIVAWSVALAGVPRCADAVPLPPVRASAETADLEVLRAALEGRVVREQLGRLGVSPADAAATLERLSPEERSELAMRAQELGAGGAGVAFLAYGIIVALIVILVLELLGRRVISGP